MKSSRRFLFTATAGLSILAMAQTAASAPPIKALGAVKLTDAAGDMGPITTSDGKVPPLDVVALAIKSDGKRITITATMKDPLGDFATVPVELYIDADNKPATGLKQEGYAGFDYVAKLDLCIKYNNGQLSCEGGSTKGKPVERYGGINLERFTGDSRYDTETVVDAMGFPGRKASEQTPASGKIVASSFEYADIKVPPGKTIRLLAIESGGQPKDGDGSFPIVVLKLN
jgi:hypothetical protein